MYAKYKSSLAGTATAMKGFLAFKQLKPSLKPKDIDEGATLNDEEENDDDIAISYEELIGELQSIKGIKNEEDEIVNLMRENPDLNKYFRSALYVCKYKEIVTWSELSAHLRTLCQVKRLTDSQKEKLANFLALIPFCKKSLKIYEGTLPLLNMEHFVEREGSEENNAVADGEEYIEYYDENVEEYFEEEENGEGQEEEYDEAEYDGTDVTVEEDAGYDVYDYGENENQEEAEDGDRELDEYYEQVYGESTEENVDEGEEQTCDEDQNESEVNYEGEYEQADEGEEENYEEDDQSEEICMAVIRSIRNIWRIYSVFAPFAGKLASDGILEELVQDLKSRTETGSDPKSRVLIETIIMMFNIAKEPTTKKRFSKFKVVNLLEKAMTLVESGYKFMVALTLALIIDDKEHALVSLGNKIIDDILKITNRAWEKNGKPYLDWSLEEMLPALCGLSKNDKRKKLLAEKGILTLLQKILRAGSEPQKEEAIKILWELSFDPENKNKIKEIKDLISSAKELSKSENEVIERAAKGVLWEINELTFRVESANQSSRSNAGRRVMISYCWDQKEIVLKIRDELLKDGHNLWFDEVNMEGSTVEAMAEAILGSDLILLCMSEAYYNRQNCRAEAQFTYKKNKNIIPLIVERGYKPEGWLDFIIGLELYIDFTQGSFDEKANKLKSYIKNKLQKTSLAP